MALFDTASQGNYYGGVTPFENMGVLGKVGLLLQSFANPNALPQYQESLMKQQYMNAQLQQFADARNEKLMAQQALSKAMPLFQSGDIKGAYAALAAAPDFVDNAMNYFAQQNDPMTALKLKIAQAELSNASRPQYKEYQVGGKVYRDDPYDSKPPELVLDIPQPSSPQEQALKYLAESYGGGSVQTPTTAPSALAGTDLGQVLQNQGFLSAPALPQAETQPNPMKTIQTAMALDALGLGETMQKNIMHQLDPSLIEEEKQKPTAESEKARKLAEESINNLSTAKSQIIKPDGSINRDVIPLNRGVSIGKSRTFTQSMERAIQNTIYLKTGATATPAEMKLLLNQYMPSVLDTDEQIKSKIDSLEQFLGSNAPNYKSKSGGVRFLGFE